MAECRQTDGKRIDTQSISGSLDGRDEGWAWIVGVKLRYKRECQGTHLRLISIVTI